MGKEAADALKASFKKYKVLFSPFKIRNDLKNKKFDKKLESSIINNDITIHS